MFMKSKYKVRVANYFWFNPLANTIFFNELCFFHMHIMQYVNDMTALYRKQRTKCP